MKNLIFVIMLVVAIMTTAYLADTNAQQKSTSAEQKLTAGNQSSSPLVVVATIYGIKPSTGNVIAFVSTQNRSSGAIFDAGARDALDGKDGIAQISLTLTSPKTGPGGEFGVCVMKLSDLVVDCNKGHDYPGDRWEYIDLSLADGRPITSNETGLK